MRKCLSADLSRMFRDRTFLLLLFGMFFCSMYLSLHQYCVSETVTPQSGLMFLFAVFVPIALSVLLPLFIGREYSDGTMRNKLIVGHSRISVYLSFLVTSFMAALLFLAVYLLVFFSWVFLTSGFSEDCREIVIPLLSAIPLLLAFCAVLVFLCMMCRNRAVSAVITILTVAALFCVGVLIESRLAAQEFIPVYELNAKGEMTEELVKNPRYLEGAKRQVYEFLYDAIPGGQAMQLMMLNGGRMPLKMSSSAVLSVWFTAVGVLIFRRKNCN